ncbi:hypothetical protein PC122_g6574 [Phytophthora cactorum]|nr:hypothetical protein PC122_g6574 [Phytophthora cactorum]
MTPTTAATASKSVVTSTASSVPACRGGHLQDLALNDVLVADGVVPCKKCEQTIHTLGKTHVERVRYNMAKKCDIAGQAERKQVVMAGVLALLTHLEGIPTPIRHVVIQHGDGQLATTLLNSCYYEARSANVLKLRGKQYTLVTDAWMDTNGQSVIYYVALDEELAIFLESDYSESISHDALYLAGDIRRVMSKYSFICFVAVVTDNTDLVRQLPWLKDPEQNCRQLVRFLKKSQQLWYESCRLQMDSKTTLVLPIDTHWETIERCFKSIKSSETILHGFVNSRDFLRSGSKEQKAKRRHADDMVVERDFVQQLDKVIGLLRVLSAF